MKTIQMGQLRSQIQNALFLLPEEKKQWMNLLQHLSSNQLEAVERFFQYSQTELESVHTSYIEKMNNLYGIILKKIKIHFPKIEVFIRVEAEKGDLKKMDDNTRSLLKSL